MRSGALGDGRRTHFALALVSRLNHKIIERICRSL
jgi:hypothetical protein